MPKSKGNAYFISCKKGAEDAAQETGVHIAAVTWGYNSTPALTEAAPDYLFTRPSELSTLLETMPPKAEG
jgi:hypothetical protein